MRVTDLERMRFAYSPLTETAESLYMLHSGRINPLHHGWFEQTRERVRHADTPLLKAVIPPRAHLAEFLLGCTVDAATTIDQQLQAVLECSPERLRAGLDLVWGGRRPPVLTQAMADRAFARRLADALWTYWQVAIEPYWPQLRALLDADVAYRAGQLARGGIEALLADLHPRLELQEQAIEIGGAAHHAEHDLTGAGLLLVPCVFAWPYLVVDSGSSGAASLTYGPRGIGTLWESASQPKAGEAALGALLGRSRAAILTSVALPRSTTDLARELGQSAPAISAHLAILRRCGMVTSWRSGRRVLYQRTPLATSIVCASTPAPEHCAQTTA